MRCVRTFTPIRENRASWGPRAYGIRKVFLLCLPSACPFSAQARLKIPSAEEYARTALNRELSNPPFRRKLKIQEPASAKEWGTHFLVKDAKT